jgi:hypothetical protein
MKRLKKPQTRQTLPKRMAAAADIPSKLGLALCGYDGIDSYEKELVAKWAFVRLLLNPQPQPRDYRQQFFRDERNRLGEVCASAMLNDDDGFFVRLSKAMKWYRNRVPGKRPADPYRAKLPWLSCSTLWR